MISGQVIGKELDQNGNIKVIIEFTLTDGSKITKNLRYNFINFTEAKILEHVQRHCEQLMVKAYSLKRHTELVGTTDLSGVHYDCTSAEVITKPAEYDAAGDLISPEEKMTVDDT
jgi:hypothetical protein